MYSEKLLKETILEDKVKKYRSLPSWYKTYKLSLMFLNFIIWIWVIYLLIFLLWNNDKYIGVFIFFGFFLGMPLNLYLINWFVYILWKVLWFTDKIENFHEENNLPKFKEAQKDLLGVIIYLIPLYISLILLLFIDLFWFGDFIFFIVLILWVLLEILWIFIRLKS